MLNESAQTSLSNSGPAPISNQSENLSSPAPPRANRKLPYKATLLAAAVLAILAGLIVYSRLAQAPALAVEIHPYFEYSEDDLNKLRQLAPSGDMSVDEAWGWQDEAYSIVEEHGAADVDAVKLYAYLGAAQLDAATLTYKAHGAFSGSLSNISKDVLCEFYQDSCTSLEINEDAYSKQLADIVMDKVRQRIVEDSKTTKAYKLKSGDQFWQGPAPQIGISAGSFKTWLIKSTSQFRPAAPPAPGSAEQLSQLASVKQALAAATNKQKAIVVKWTGGPGTKTSPGIWLALTDNYMREQQLPLGNYLQIRAVTSMAMADAVGAVFDTKYTYQYKRPKMFDTSIKTIMPSPNHPSYPAGHSAISWTAATVLSHYLPQNQQEWERLAVEAGYSRIIGGVHFPMDDKSGTELAKNIGNEAVKNW